MSGATSTSQSVSVGVVNKPSPIEHKHLKFLIMDAPTDANLESYIQVLKKKNVTAVVRACKPTYSTAPLIKEGIKVVELPFEDGAPPPKEVMSAWLSLVEEEFAHPDRCIAVHCVAGLGRAPVLVALALMETGMDSMDTVDFIRKHRRGAINARQLQFLETYKPRSAAGSCCVVC